MNGHFLTEIEIKEFKCFTDFKASGFKRVNLIGGKNNVGKTAFMEACYVNVHGKDVNSLITAIAVVKYMREGINLIAKKADRQELLDNTKIYNADSNIGKATFYIDIGNARKNYLIEINAAHSSIEANGIFIDFAFITNITFIDNFGFANIDLIRVFQSIQKHDKENELNNCIKEFDPSIQNFKVIGDKPQCKINNDYLDIVEFGDGLKHYISIICALYASENGYLFIDEIDNGIHYTQLDRLWELILTLSKKTNCQVFATTHSKEMLESFARVAKKLDEQDISYTTLVKNNQQEIKSITQDYEMLLYSMAQEHEVR